MPKKKKLTKAQKEELAHSKLRMNEAIHEIKVDKKMKKEIDHKGVSHPKLLSSPIIRKGVTNNFLEKEHEYQVELKKFKEVETGAEEIQELKNKNKEMISKLKDKYQADLKKLKDLGKDNEEIQKLKTNNEEELSRWNTSFIEQFKAIKEKYAVIKEKAKEELHKRKQLMKVEEIIINEEVKEINKLNKTSKGQVLMDNISGDAITLKNVNKYYSQKHMIFKALADVDVSIKKGTFNVILGPSGSGKTTLLNMISGLDRNTYGDVVINGTNIAALSSKELTQFRRKYIGFVFQSYNLLASLDVSDNIEVGRSLQQDPKKRVNITDLLQDMDMSQNEKKKTYELSGGQQQRVSIARALAKSPDILIGDEPTGALDQKTSLKVFELFQDINKKQKSTVIIVTHNVNVAKLADQVIHVKNGRIDKVVTNKNPLQAKNMKEI